MSSPSDVPTLFSLFTYQISPSWLVLLRQKVWSLEVKPLSAPVLIQSVRSREPISLSVYLFSQASLVGLSTTSVQVVTFVKQVSLLFRRVSRIPVYLVSPSLFSHLFIQDVSYSLFLPKARSVRVSSLTRVTVLSEFTFTIRQLSPEYSMQLLASLLVKQQVPFMFLKLFLFMLSFFRVVARVASLVLSFLVSKQRDTALVPQKMAQPIVRPIDIAQKTRCLFNLALTFVLSWFFYYFFHITTFLLFICPHYYIIFCFLQQQSCRKKEFIV